jgi:hypothetical protein
VRGPPGGSPRAALEIDKFGQIIAAAEKELPIAEARIEAVQRTLKEAILPEKMNVLPDPNTFNQSIGHRPLDFFLWYERRGSRSEVEPVHIKATLTAIWFIDVILIGSQ